MKANDAVGAGEAVSVSPPSRAVWSGWAIIVGWIAMGAFTFYACSHMVAAGDTWVAMACGRHFVNHGVNTVEPFSVNSHKAGPTAQEVKKWPNWAQWITAKVGLSTMQRWHPTGWIDQNWLTHVIFYKLSTALGSEADPCYNALVLWKFAIYILAALTLYYTSRLYGVHPVLAAMFVCFAMVIGRSYFDIRPAGFSNLLVAVMILVLALASYKNALYIWLLVPLVIFWSNVHGGYIYAFIVLIPFVAWQALMLLPRRWMIATYSILLWLVLCVMSNRFTHHEYLKAIALGQDVLFYLTVVAIVGSIGLAASRKVGEEAFLVYHVSMSCLLFLVLLPRFFPAVPEMLRLRPDDSRDLTDFIALSRLSFVGIFAFALVLGTVVVFLKEKVARGMDRRGILHMMAAGAVAFVAMVIFNPFHLTNLTHTFEISISKHAERWRNVYEWHRAFEWDNPVGTAVPFLIMYILAWLVLIAWTIFFLRAARTANRPVGRRLKATVPYAWPRLDLGLLVVAAMTLYLGLRSRRFIPIAGFAVCPLLALLVQQAADRLLVTFHLRRAQKADPALLGPAVGEATLLGVTAALVVAALWYLPLDGLGWLFTPIKGEEDFTRPNIVLVFLMMASAVAAFVVAVRRYAAAKWPEAPADGGPKHELRPGHLVQTAMVLLCVLALGFSAWFVGKFKRVYLDPWPLDAKYSSAFMRMTASYSKPFEACEFMRLNKLSGTMFNYWTEGGFIAWGQEPDPETGRIPLQLFMDGRAQAAYDVSAFDRWSDIMTGGPVAYEAGMAGRKLTTKNYIDIGAWITKELRQCGIWIVLMPVSPNPSQEKPFVVSFDFNNDWRTVYLDDKQKMFVDIGSPPGRALCDGMLNGQTKYPNAYLRDMALGHTLLLSLDPAQRRQGLEHVVKALDEYPSPAPMRELLTLAWQFPELRARVDEVCRQYAKPLQETHAAYARQDGYNFHLHVARMASARMEMAAQGRQDAGAMQTFADQVRQYDNEIARLGDQNKW